MASVFLKCFIHVFFSPILNCLYSSGSCYWRTGPWRSLSPGLQPLAGLFYSYRGRQMLLSISPSRRTSFPVGSAPGLRIWILRVGRSTPTRLPASPRCSPHTRLWASRRRRPVVLSPLSQLLQFVKCRLSFLSMAVRGVIRIQQRNS